MPGPKRKSERWEGLVKNGKMYLLWLGENSACGGSGAGGRPQGGERPFYRAQGAASRQEMEKTEMRPQGKEGTWETVGEIVRRIHRTSIHWILGIKGLAAQYGSHQPQ